MLAFGALLRCLRHVGCFFNVYLVEGGVQQDFLPLSRRTLPLHIRRGLILLLLTSNDIALAIV